MADYRLYGRSWHAANPAMDANDMRPTLVVKISYHDIS